MRLSQYLGSLTLSLEGQRLRPLLCSRKRDLGIGLGRSNGKEILVGSRLCGLEYTIYAHSRFGDRTRVGKTQLPFVKLASQPLDFIGRSLVLFLQLINDVYELDSAQTLQLHICHAPPFLHARGDNARMPAQKQTESTIKGGA